MTGESMPVEKENFEERSCERIKRHGNDRCGNRPMRVSLQSSARALMVNTQSECVI